MSSLAELDPSNVVDIDLCSAEFMANAHRLMTESAPRTTAKKPGEGESEFYDSSARSEGAPVAIARSRSQPPGSSLPRQATCWSGRISANSRS
jgi:hypothetical protein